MAGSRVEIERFDGRGDFALWRQRMRAILVQMKVVKALQGEASLPATLTAEEKADLMELAYSTIILHLGDKVLREVSKERIAAGIWLKLEQLYMTKTLTNRVYLKGKLFGFKMTDGKPVEDCLDEFAKIVIDLENIGVKVEDEDQAIMILNSLPPSYSTFVETMKYSRESLSLEEVLSALKSKQIESQVVQNQGDSLFVRGRSDKKNSDKNRSASKSSAGRSKSPFKNNSKKSFKCFLCHKEGHYKRNCPERKNKPSSSGQTEMVNCVDEGYDSAEVLVVAQGETSSQWILDSGCTFHMSPNKLWFQDLREERQGSVLLGNNMACSVMGIGSIKLKMADGQVKILSEVRYIPELKRNLISLGMLDKSGYSFKSQNGTMTIARGSLVVMKGVRKNGLYILSGETVVPDQVNAVVNGQDKIVLWHLRLAHVSEAGLQKLKEHGCFGKDQIGKLSFCENCVMGKSNRVKFGTGIHRTEGILDYVHSDLWGPSRNISKGGKRYFMTIIDDYSRRVWIYFLAHKGDAFSAFKDWKVQVENQTNRKIKRLRTDNGLEFLNSEFSKLCKMSGISKHHTVAGTPQQNGLAERYNRTILERVRCMLLQSGVDKSFWAEAAHTACYLINRCPSSAIGFKTPMQMWSDHKVDYTKLKVFGCAAYAHVKQGKLEPRAIKCIFLGYPEGVKGYKLWSLEAGAGRTIISRDVVFNEEEFPMRKEIVTENLRNQLVLNPVETKT